MFDREPRGIEIAAFIREENAMSSFDREPPAEAHARVLLRNRGIAFTAVRHEDTQCVELGNAAFGELELLKPFMFFVGQSRT